MGRKDPRFWPAAGVVLDVLDATGGRVSEAAACLGITTGNLIDFLATDPKVWAEANLRHAYYAVWRNDGAPGVDGQTIAQFKAQESEQLAKLSGSPLAISRPIFRM